MPYQLVPAAASHQPVRLDRAVVLFGRHPDCDVVITSSRKVSRRHCCVAQIDNGFVVRDLGSMNGVRVNGQPVKGTVPLRLGDELVVGDVVFHLKDVVFHLKEVSANGKSARAKAPKAAPPQGVPGHMLSQDVPVIIPDEEQSFSVEESIVKSPTDSDLPIELSADDIVDDDSQWDVEVVE